MYDDDFNFDEKTENLLKNIGYGIAIAGLLIIAIILILE